MMKDSDRDRRGSCADARVCSNGVINNRKVLATAGVVGNSALVRI
jgi:hypothetical protein